MAISFACTSWVAAAVTQQMLHVLYPTAHFEVVVSIPLWAMPDWKPPSQNVKSICPLLFLRKVVQNARACLHQNQYDGG